MMMEELSLISIDGCWRGCLLKNRAKIAKIEMNKRQKLNKRILSVFRRKYR